MLMLGLLLVFQPEVKTHLRTLVIPLPGFESNTILNFIKSQVVRRGAFLSMSLVLIARPPP